MYQQAAACSRLLLCKPRGSVATAAQSVCLPAVLAAGGRQSAVPEEGVYRVRFFVLMPPHLPNLDAKERGNYSVIPPALKTGTNRGGAER